MPVVQSLCLIACFLGGVGLIELSARATNKDATDVVTLIVGVISMVWGVIGLIVVWTT